jgi:hypothetical protein
MKYIRMITVGSFSIARFSDKHPPLRAGPKKKLSDFSEL